MKFTINQKIFFAAVFGVLVGFILSVNAESSYSKGTIEFLGIVSTLFISMLKMVIIPLIFSSITVGIASLQQHKHANRIWKITLAFYIFSMCLATLVGLTAVNYFEPGKGAPPVSFGTAESVPLEKLTTEEFFKQFVSGIFMNPISAMAEGKILPTVVFAFFFGVGLLTLGDKVKTVFLFMQQIFRIMMKIIGWIIEILPIGIFCLLAKLVATQDPAIFISVGIFMAVVIGATLFHGFVVLPLLLWFFGGMGPITFFRGISSALITAFSTASSSATFPVTLRCVTENLKVDKSIAGFVLPIGATMNMDGTALYEAIAAIFVANLIGIDFHFGQQCIVFMMAMIASIGAPGIPSAGMVTMVLVLQSVGLPAEAIAILLPIDRILDTVRTMVNVEGDAIGSIVVQNFID